jgi:hypothetical protein
MNINRRIRRFTQMVICPAVLAVGAATFLAGCKSTTTVTTDPFGNSITNVTKTIDTARIATISRQAATVGTSEVLASHPEWRPQFQLAADNLRLLATSPSISLDTLLAIAQQLPVKELKSQTARLSFEGATLLISAIDVPELPADRLAELQPIALAIAEGIVAGMPALPSPVSAPLPPPTTN